MFLEFMEEWDNYNDKGEKWEIEQSPLLLQAKSILSIETGEGNRRTIKCSHDEFKVADSYLSIKQRLEIASNSALNKEGLILSEHSICPHCSSIYTEEEVDKCAECGAPRKLE